MLRRKLHLIISTIWVIAGLAFLIWLFLSFEEQGFDASVLKSDEIILVENTSEAIKVMPFHQESKTALIFYPGAMVDPTAYAPLARNIAEKEYAVFIVKLPLRLAPFPSHVEHLFSLTNQIMQDNPQIEKWIICGHSKGGALAAKFTKLNAISIEGLILMATTHPKDSESDLSNITIPVLKISASCDGLASSGEILQNKIYLPSQTIFNQIDGGNHSQFGYYGKQIGDNTATITREEQQKETLITILQFLERFCFDD
jgi:hypothetical protein